MHIHFLQYLRDPHTQEALGLDVVEQSGDRIVSGYLFSSTNRFPIINGIPRFVASEEYTKSFGWQWNHWSRVQFDSENLGKKMEGHTAKMWQRITGMPLQAEPPIEEIIIDIGCGPGRFIETARARNSKAFIIGIDYSNAVEAAQRNFKHDERVCIIQADALNLPLLSECVDGAYSIGVLHHTPNPEFGIKEASRVLKKKGWLAVSVYGTGSYYGFSTVQIWRKFFKLLWPRFGEKPALLYTYATVNLLRPIARVSRLAGLGVRLLFPFANLPDKDWSLLDTFDSITPSYQSTHDSVEVFQWFKNAGFVDIEPMNWGSTSYKGVIT